MRDEIREYSGGLVAIFWEGRVAHTFAELYQSVMYAHLYRAAVS